jgi:hypothetical protein
MSAAQGAANVPFFGAALPCFVAGLCVDRDRGLLALNGKATLSEPALSWSVSRKVGWMLDRLQGQAHSYRFEDDVYFRA